ncbi:MAG: hypothetical protein PHS84_03705 [Paludibacter sp.]|jgi:hypothetical protein|nr:hypothetical protein [Paludibacter sp.]
MPEKSTNTILPLFTLLMLVLGWSGWIALRQLYPVMDLGWYLFLPGSFFVMGCVLILILEKVNKENPRRLVNIYMMLKLSKLVIALSIILLYYFIVKENMGLFLIVFGIYYAVYLLVELYVFYITEKKIKQNK